MKFQGRALVFGREGGQNRDSANDHENCSKKSGFHGLHLTNTASAGRSSRRSRKIPNPVTLCIDKFYRTYRLDKPAVNKVLDLEGFRAHGREFKRSTRLRQGYGAAGAPNAQ
jgi:hypothetical protein